MAKPVFEVDKRSLRGLQNAIDIYSRATKKSFPDVINRTALNLAFRAAQFTVKADIKKEASYIQNTLGMRNAFAVTQWFYRKHRGGALRTKAALLRATNRLIAARVSYRGFIAGGWAKAGRDIKSKANVSGKIFIKGIRKRTGIGKALAARQALVSFATLFNMSVSKKSTGAATSPAALERFGGEGLNKAVRFVAADMIGYAREKLAKQAARFNAR